MKTILLSIMSCFLFFISINAQNITGIIIEQYGEAVSDLNLQLFTSSKVYTTKTSSDGSFVFNNITGVKKEQMPSGYSVSDNYPNPFNPKTRIGFTLPARAGVKVNIFNQLGQRVKEITESYYSAGNNFIDLELNGHPNGIYIAQITLDGKYSFTRKLMLLYGSQHLISSNGLADIPQSNLCNGNTKHMVIKLDSLVVTGSTIQKKVFANLLYIEGSSVDLGYLIVTRLPGIPCIGTPTVTYAGRTYNTVLIGRQCWLKENINIGSIIRDTMDQTNNGIIEKYCYNNDTSYCEKYGGLYQWDEAVQYNNAGGICPDGWRIPSINEFQTLSSAVSNLRDGLLATGQLTGTNSSGFSALLGGDRNAWSLSFIGLGVDAYFWSSTIANENNAYLLNLVSAESNIVPNIFLKKYGFSVRCIKN